MKKQIIKLTESDLHRIIKESVKRVLRETKDDEINASWDEFDADDDYLRDKYAEDAMLGDNNYNLQQTNYNGVLSMLKQYGYDAEIEDGDPEGEYPPMLTLYHKPGSMDNLNAAIKFLGERGWNLIKQFSGEQTRRGIVYSFRPSF